MGTRQRSEARTVAVRKTTAPMGVEGMSRAFEETGSELFMGQGGPEHD